MSDRPLRVDGTFDSEILENRRRLVNRLEEIADNASKFRTSQGDQLCATIPLVTVGVIDAVRMVQEASGNGAIEMSNKEFREVLDRSGVKTQHLLDGQIEAARVATNKAVGVAFELDLPDLIRSGQVPVPSGTDTVKLNTFTHPGSDLTFLDSSGHVVMEANAKASMSWDVIREHFRLHPDVSVVYATHEAAVSAAEHGMTVVGGANVVIPSGSGHIVVDTGLNASDYREAILGSAGHHDHGLFHFLNSHHLFNEIPWFTIALLAYRARKRSSEGMPWIENKVRTAKEAGKSGAAIVTAGTLQHLGVPIPVTVASSFFSAAILQGAFDVRDEWGFMAAYEDSLAQRTSRLAGV